MHVQSFLFMRSSLLVHRCVGASDILFDLWQIHRHSGFYFVFSLLPLLLFLSPSVTIFVRTGVALIVNGAHHPLDVKLFRSSRFSSILAIPAYVGGRIRNMRYRQ